MKGLNVLKHIKLSGICAILGALSALPESPIAMEEVKIWNKTLWEQSPEDAYREYLDEHQEIKEYIDESNPIECNVKEHKYIPLGHSFYYHHHDFKFSKMIIKDFDCDKLNIFFDQKCYN